MKLLRYYFLFILIIAWFNIPLFSQNINFNNQQNKLQITRSIVSFTQNIYDTIYSFFVREIPIPPNAIYTQQSLQDSFLFQTLSSIKKQIPPFIYDKYAIFTYFDNNENSTVYITSSNNNYKELLPFIRLESNKKVLVLLLPREASNITLQYRMVINGVWSYDVSNPNTMVDPNGITLSTITIPSLSNQYIPSFIPLGNNHVRFVLSQSVLPIDLYSTSMRHTAIDINTANTVYINANFTGWDPFLIKMQHSTTIQGAYTADITLRPGTHYYYFQIDGKSILDPKNEDIVKLKNGIYVNRIVISDTS